MTGVKRVVPLMLLALGVLVGCGPALPGSAAIVGEQRLDDATLSDTTSALAGALGIEERPELSQAVLSRWVVGELIDEYAARQGIEITNGQVDAVIAEEAERAGGAEQLEQSALQSGLLPEMIPDAVRTSLLVEEMSKRAANEEDPSGQQGLVLGIQALSDELDTRVSPRFGTWDPEQLTVGSLPDDLSSPVAGDDPLRQLQQLQ